MISAIWDFIFRKCDGASGAVPDINVEAVKKADDGV